MLKKIKRCGEDRSALANSFIIRRNSVTDIGFFREGPINFLVRVELVETFLVFLNPSTRCAAQDERN